jgi:hypothetical protein
MHRIHAALPALVDADGAQPPPMIIARVTSSLSSTASRIDFCRGTMAVTGTPSLSTRWTWFGRSHLEVCLGSVEMMIFVEVVFRTASWIAANGSGPPTSLIDRASGRSA